MRRTFRSAAVIAVFLMAAAAVSFGQAPADKKAETAKSPVNPAASSPAYAELLLKRTELLSQLESLILEYTEEFPKVKEIRQTLTLIERESSRLAKVKAADSSRLTLALGKLMVRKVELESDLLNLRKSYQEEHPDIKRARRRVEIYEAAISEILN